MFWKPDTSIDVEEFAKELADWFLKMVSVTQTKIIVFRYAFQYMRQRWPLLKQYAKAKRDYEVDKGFTMRNALEELVDNSLMALRDVEFTDSNGNLVDWKNLEVR